MCIVDLVENLKLALRHHNLHRLPVLKLDINRQNADSDFVIDTRASVAAVWKRNKTFARERVPGPDNRMTGKRNFANRREDAQATQNFVSLRIRLQHEDCLRQIHLASDLHHRLIAETFRFWKHCQRIAGKKRGQ